ncbi:hypothetical protein [Endozoicomonas sp. SESOKO1]|uniref:hypothetical protein n=1 Tax=Endozoicomonas sp. SESOKO1 TaxID=2828742 RepID=UPI0021488725|nr:hypothetical protein [Endozoicomonas sp. SESOKO1]
MNSSDNKSTLWSRVQSTAMKIRKNGLKEVTGVVSFSLFFIMGLVTLGACLLAGVAAVIIAKWQHHKNRENDATEPANDQNPNNNPIVAA